MSSKVIGISARKRIRLALRDVLSHDAAKVSRVWKDEDGWYFEGFDSTPTYLGNNLDEALVEIKAIAEEANR